MPDRPPETVPLPGAVLTRNRTTDLEDIVTALQSALDHLSPWMPWASAENATVEVQGPRLADAVTKWDAGEEFVWVLRADVGSPVLGAIGLHRRVGPGGIEIGYWLHPSAVGRGLMTAAARAVTAIAWTLPDVERIEIHTDEANVRSAAIPRRLGYPLERVEDRDPQAPAESGVEQIWIRRAA